VVSVGAVAVTSWSPTALSCIAAATGGTYSDATDAGQLTTQALQTKVDYAITGYTTAGTPVAGADQPSDQAPLLAPGQYVDTLAQGASDDIIGVGTTKYYTIPVQKGVRPVHLDDHDPAGRPERRPAVRPTRH